MLLGIRGDLNNRLRVSYIIVIIILMKKWSSEMLCEHF